MKKILMAAAAACAFTFAGTAAAAAADIPAPEGWTVTVVEGVPTFKKEATGFAINMINMPSTGYTLESAAKEVIQSNPNCKITVAAQTEQDLECADGRQVNILQSGAEQYTIITSVCGKTDKTSCEADFKEFLTFVASLGK